MLYYGWLFPLRLSHPSRKRNSDFGIKLPFDELAEDLSYICQDVNIFSYLMYNN